MIQAQKDRKLLEDKLQEADNQRQDAEEKLKNLLRIKTKLENQLTDLEERLKRETEVCYFHFKYSTKNKSLLSFSFVKHLNVKYVDLKLKIKIFVLNYKIVHKMLMIYNYN